VQPTIATDWEIAKKNGIIDADFYLADLLSSENKTLKEILFVLLKTNYYEFDKMSDSTGSGFFNIKTALFRDGQKAHTQFWAKYERPPIAEYWDYLVDHRHLLVPQDIRERKGSFYTPRIWVELSQRYLADAFGENWQEEYYVWDCAAGTGNLLAGLTNKYNIWASTLDKADVDVMRDRIQNGANLLEDHVFQFDFLNDEFSKLPKGLQDIINNERLRKKLIVYINPPYAEAGTGLGRKHKDGVAITHKTHNKYIKTIGNAINELSAQFTTRIYDEIPNAKVAIFSKLAYLNGPNYKKFRSFFQAKFENGFLVPSYTFDNVKGKFPIGFIIWNSEKKEHINKIVLNVYNEKRQHIGKKMFFDGLNCKYINDWFRYYFDKENYAIGILHNNKNDFQHNNQVRITSDDIKDHTTTITKSNLITA
jgi:hypothetical protein